MTSCSRIFRTISLAASVAFGLITAIDQSHAAVAPVVTTLSSITEGLSTPVRAAQDLLGNFYVTDPRGGGVLKFNNAGRLQKKISVVNPLGIAIASSGDLLVAQGGAVAVVNPVSGTISSTFGTFIKANGIAVDANNFIYVTDSLDNCVQVFNAAYAPVTTGVAATGKPANSFGTKGTQNGQFQQPTGISFERISNQLAVVDTRNGRIQFFSTTGAYQKTIGSFGSGPLKFTSPQAVAFEYTADDTALSRIYIADSFQSNLQVIDATTGVFSRYIGSYGLTGGKLVTPGDVILDRFDSLNKRLLITNGTGALTVFGIDNAGTTPSTGPSLAVNSVPLATNLPLLTITGTTESGATVTINGTAATVTGTAWARTITLAEGFNLITITAANSNGSTLKTVNTYLLPPTANQVNLTMNPLPSMTGSAGITLSGTVTSGASVLINSTPAIVTGTAWSLPVTLNPGINSFLVTASMAGMSNSTTSVNIIFDNVAPVLNTFLPQNNSTTSNAVLTITGTVIDASPATITVTVKDINQTVITSQTVPVNDGAFNLAIVLTGGTNVIAVSAIDAAGNPSGFASSTIIYNPLNPNIILTTPNGAVTASPTQVISGTAPAGSVITINGQPVTLNGTSWTTTVTLVPGLNQFSIRAADPVSGAASTIVASVTYGQNLPAVAITNPAQDLATSESTITISGTVSSVSAITGTMNGSALPVTITGEGTFSLTLPALTTPGSYVVNVSATDNSGNTATATRTLIYDPSTPVISVSSTSPPKVTSTGGVLVAFDKNGPVGTVTVSGGVSSLDLTGVAYDPATLNIYSITAAGTSTRNGDINNDGQVDIADALLALRILIGLAPPASFVQMLHGDVGPIQNHNPSVDGQIRMSDVVVIMERVIGIAW
jgi:uncharacterized Zn-binding protein involved in type VI secretion